MNPLNKLYVSRKKKYSVLASLLIVITILSMAYLPLIASDVPQGNNVSWQSQTDTTQTNYNWTNQGWQFGPYPSFTIIMSNGSVVTNENYLPLDQQFTVQIDIQKSIFVGNATLGQAGLNWGVTQFSDNGSYAGSANCNMIYVNLLQQPGYNQSNVWQVNSNINSQPGTPVGGIMQPQPQKGFYQFNSQLSNITESDMGWRLDIVGFFNSSSPLGPYHVNLQVSDQFNNWMDVSSQSAQNTLTGNRQVAVGQAGFAYGGAQDFWTFEKLDIQNNPLMSVSKGGKFKMRLNVTSTQFSNATIAMNMPFNIQRYVNVTGWYDQVSTTLGGWMLNQTSGAYFWNSTVSVTHTQQVWGPHLEQRWVSLQNSNHQVNVTNFIWNMTTNRNELVTQPMWFSDQLFLIYNHATNSFDIKTGYAYQTYDPTAQMGVQIQVLNPLNASDPLSQFFTLSLADCSYNQISSNKQTIDFVGLFSNTTSYEQNQYSLQVNAYSAKKQIYADWQSTTQSDMQVIIDRPVAVSTILDSQGHPATTQNMFMITPTKPIIVQSKIYGGSQVYSNLDAIGVSFNSNFGTWTSNENSNSQIEIRLTKNLDTGVISSVSYNRTSVNKYVYGSHLGWDYVNVTDWHTEYNADSGIWDWVQSPHLIWNQTTLTDWHWEYARLNQTEYARDPNSPNIWMDTTTTWVDDSDPAFVMPNSYATMNSANMTMTNGIIEVNLGVTFGSSAPQGNYWYNMLFQNLTFGQDPSQGYGQHLTTEWTSQQTYFINGSASGGQEWFVDAPSTPLFTIYNATKYQVTQVPYITVDGNNLLIKPQVQYDQFNQQDWKQYLINGQYDPSTGSQSEYYQLYNGTNIYVKQAYQTINRTLTLNVTGAYSLVGDAKVSLPNGTIINTYLNRASQDYSRQYWDTILGWILPNYYTLFNGTKVYLDSSFEQSNYNATTNHFELSGQVYIENDSTLRVQSAGSGVTLNDTVYLIRNPGWWQVLPDGSGYYLVMQNGTRITVKDYSVPDNQRFATINGLTYTVGWTNQYYNATYQGQTLLIPSNTPNGDACVQSYFYTDLGIDSGAQFEMPYPGATATSQWDLQGVESTGQKLKTVKSISIDGIEHVMTFDVPSQSYYVVVDGQRKTVPYPTVDFNNFYSTINGQDSWNITQNGWIVNYGTLSQQTNQISGGGSFVTTTGYDPAQKTWANYNHYGMDNENSTYYLTYPNGTRVDVSSAMDLIVWKVQIGDQTYYTTDSTSSSESAVDASGQSVWRNYFKTIDNQKVYFDWNSPASWTQETHIPIPGTNYTKLIPYTWQAQTVFDKVVLYNITIPSNGTTGHTGVFFENGIEITVGTPLKVYGTASGPGTLTYVYPNGNGYTFAGDYSQCMLAPFNNNLNVYYAITIDGSRIYSLYSWNPADSNPLQWQFNGTPETANQTVSIELGGYAVYLNDTIMAPTTTSNVFGGPTNYIVLTNGTRLDVQREYSFGRYLTVVGTDTYVFNEIVPYSNLTDGGITYSFGNPFMGSFDQKRTLTASTYQVPTVDSGSGWLLMNATSESILHDGTGYYLVNALNSGRLDLEQVDQWWNVSNTIRSQVFTGQLSDYYPRFNVTINGVEYFVTDPSSTIDRWYGDSQAKSRYPNSIPVTLDGITYNVNLGDSYWFNNLTITNINTINLNGSSYELDRGNWKPSYQVVLSGQDVPIQMENMNIYKTHQSWGNIYTWKLTDLGFSTTSQINNLVVGTPQWGMWGIKAYKTVESTGAVDLDGDTSNAADQYFVRKVHQGIESQSQTTQRMMVDTNWNPNGSRVGDDIRFHAWMGQLQVNWSSQWSESYIWYHASDMSAVGSQEMTQIQNKILNNVTKLANPGYWDISYMARNQSWDDVLAQAEANNWDWMSSNTNSWNWLWFGTDQNYNVNVISGNTISTAGVDLKYEFAGLNLLNGTQQTNYFMPKTVEKVSFVTPGQAYGDMSATGSMLLPLSSNITFGVTYDNVNGTLFPYSDQRSMWGWWDSPIYGTDFNAPNLLNKPTTASTSQLQFMVHFAGIENSTSQYNSASMKIDQRVGDWTLPSDVVDGREQNSSGVMVPLVGNAVLANRSLAINYYVSASTSLAWNVKDDKGSNVNNNGVTNSSQFDLASQAANINFAAVKLGSNYDWGKPTTPTDDVRTLNVTSQTTSIQNFQSSYQSGAGKSSTGFDITSSMYFLTQGFPSWDGYSIYNDPEVSTMVSQGTYQEPTQPTPPPPPTTQPTSNPTTQPTGQPISQPTNQPTPKPSTPSPTNIAPPTSPQPTANPTTQQQTPKPTTSPPTQVPTAIIAIGIGAGLAVAIGSVLLVRTRKKRSSKAS